MKRAIITAFLSAFVSLAVYAQVADRQLVNNAFPAELGDGGKHFSRFITVDLNRNGQLLLVAVYTNSVVGAVRVLNRAGQVIAAPDLPGMRGFHASVKALDLDGDGIPEILAEFTTGHSPDNPDTWVFRWAGNALQLISPICPTGELSLTCMGHVLPIDMDGTGHYSLLDSPGLQVNDGVVSTVCDWTLWKLSNGTFQEAPQTFSFAREFTRGSGKPFTSVRKIIASPGAATLRVINGSGAAASTSGQVTLNGKNLLGSADFKRSQHVFDVPVTLIAENNLAVRLDGKPGSSITVLILTAGTPGGKP